MCRFVAYLGEPIKISSVLLKPTHSLMQQSINAKESNYTINSDGFGISWYTPNDPKPALFKTLSPIWNDPNVIELCNITSTHCMSAHIRAATTGNLTRNNSHPFRYDSLSMMHNGNIEGFSDIKRSIQNLLCDPTYNWIQGQTDSEHFFALIINFMMKLNIDIHTINPHQMLHCFELSLATIEDLVDQHSDQKAISLNTVMTNGQSMLVTRFANDPNEMRSLYYLTGHQYTCSEDGHTIVTDTNHATNSKPMIIVASEKLTDLNKNWIAVPPNHALTVSANGEHAIVNIQPPSIKSLN